MPVDMASPLHLSKEEFVCTPSPDTCAPPPSSCLRLQRPANASRPDDERPARRAARKPKKQVTFADHRGLSLTRVKVFSQFSDHIGIPPSARVAPSAAPSAAQSAAPAPPPAEDELLLDFAQPSSDYLRFHQSLETNGVCLERCVLGGGALAGTVKVQNLSFEKSVKLRVTFDTWKSHSDVACVYVQDSYPGSLCDTFSFRLALPERPPPPHERTEFAVRYLVGSREFWDNNRGRNYPLLRASVKRRQEEAAAHFGTHFDRFGSPACSHGLLADWPSYAAYEGSGPYY